MMRSCWNKRWWAAHWSLDRNFKPHLKFAAGFAHCCNILLICFCNIFEIVAILRIFATFDNFLQFCALVQHLTIVLPIDQHLSHLLSQKCMFGKCNLKKVFSFLSKGVFFKSVFSTIKYVNSLERRALWSWRFAHTIKSGRIQCNEK